MIFQSFDAEDLFAQDLLVVPELGRRQFSEYCAENGVQESADQLWVRREALREFADPCAMFSCLIALSDDTYPMSTHSCVRLRTDPRRAARYCRGTGGPRPALHRHQ